MTEPVQNGIDPQLVYEYTAGRVPAETPGLQHRIDAVLASLKGHCGWIPFPVRTETLILDAVGQNVLVLPTKKLRAVNAVRVLGVSLPPKRTEWSHDGLVYLRAEGEFLELTERVRWPHRLRGIEIEIEHGYELADCMNLLDSVCSTIERSVYNPRGASMIRVGERQTGFTPGAGGGVIGTLPLGDQLATWDAYRLPPVSWEGG